MEVKAYNLSQDIELEQTCWACPEQYDATYDLRVVGYLRLRWGYFTVRFLGPGGEIIYSTSDCEGDGLFASHEREFYLGKARYAIAMKILESEAEGKEGG